MQTEQTDFWSGEFGKDYTERNTFTPQELDSIYKEQYGITRTGMSQEFIADLEVSSALEVGCNVGNQLRHLQQFGLNQLYGVELQEYAVERSKSLTKGINIIQGSAFDLPFKDAYFDMVYTFGVLIHIAPADLGRVMDEVHRVSKRYIWGFEYYSDEYVEINYRGHQSKMWKGNFAQLYLDRFPNLQLVKQQKYPYIKNSNIDMMFLLEKKMGGS